MVTLPTGTITKGFTIIVIVFGVFWLLAVFYWVLKKTGLLYVFKKRPKLNEKENIFILEAFVYETREAEVKIALLKKGYPMARVESMMAYLKQLKAEEVKNEQRRSKEDIGKQESTSTTTSSDTTTSTN